MLTTQGVLESADASAANRSSRLRVVSLWTLQIFVAATILTTGGAKLLGVPMMVATFEHIGLGQWLRHVTGGIEVLSALALLVPAAAFYGALAVVATMIGAIAAHVFVMGGSAAPAAAVLAAATGIAWGRRRDIAGSLRKARSGRFD